MYETGVCEIRRGVWTTPLPPLINPICSRCESAAEFHSPLRGARDPPSQSQYSCRAEACLRRHVVFIPPLVCVGVSQQLNSIAPLRGARGFHFTIPIELSSRSLLETTIDLYKTTGPRPPLEFPQCCQAEACSRLRGFF